MTPTEMMTNLDYLSSCVMKYLCRGQMDTARFYLDRLIELHKKREVLRLFFIN